MIWVVDYFEVPEQLGNVALTFTLVNFYLGITNLIPLPGTDGGMAIISILEMILGEFSNETLWVVFALWWIAILAFIAYGIFASL